MEGDARRELVGKKELTGQLARDDGQRQLARNHEQGQSTPDTGAVRPVGGDGVQTNERRSSQDESAFQLLCGIFARIHVSVGLYMLSEMQCYITPCLAL